MSLPGSANPAVEPAGNPALAAPPLPVAQLESLKFKLNQMIDSIQLLQYTVEMGGQNVMPAWPDILSKYNILLSQSHNLSTSLVALHQTVGGKAQNPFERLALHPKHGMTDAQLDNELIPLLRNQQTTDVLRIENETVKHLSEHMRTKGSLGVLSATTASGPGRLESLKRTTYDDVLAECEQIRVEHDLRVERAVRAVTMLRDKYDWKARVEVDQEEPEELEWDPLFQGDTQTQSTGDAMIIDGQGRNSPDGGRSNDTEDEEELEEVLGNGVDQTPESSPMVGITES